MQLSYEEIRQTALLSYKGPGNNLKCMCFLNNSLLLNLLCIPNLRSKFYCTA